MSLIQMSRLLAEPKCLSPEWRLVFQVFTKPIKLIITLRDRLTTEIQDNPKGHQIVVLPTFNNKTLPKLDLVAPSPWDGGLQTYNKHLGECCDQMDETLGKLSIVAPKTFDAGCQIRDAIGPVHTALSGVSVLFQGTIPFTPDERHNRILVIRHRVFEASKNFAEMPLIEGLREAISFEIQIELDLNPRETIVHSRSVLPSAGARSPTAADTLPMKEPSDAAFKVYRYQLATGKKQTDLAVDPELMKLLKRTVSQGSISRWLGQVANWIKAGNVLPDLPTVTTKPSAMDPELIDLGKNKERRTPRQRSRRKDV